MQGYFIHICSVSDLKAILYVTYFLLQARFQGAAFCSAAVYTQMGEGDLAVALTKVSAGSGDLQCCTQPAQYGKKNVQRSNL